MKNLSALLFFAAAILAGCSKNTPEPEPAEQVIGTYNVDKYVESVKYATSPTETSQTTNYPLKDSKGNELSIVLDVAKVSANAVTVTLTQTYKPVTGQSQKQTDAFGTLDIKKPDAGAAGVFDLYDGATKVGNIGNNTILFEEQSTEKDSLGRTFVYIIKLSGKKAN